MHVVYTENVAFTTVTQGKYVACFAVSPLRSASQLLLHNTELNF